MAAIELAVVNNAASFSDGESVGHFKVPESGNLRPGVACERLPDSHCVGGHWIIHKPSQGYRGVQDKANQRRPSAIMSSR